MTLFVLVGIPGSGKSTWAQKNSQSSVISFDEIRKELFGDEAVQYNPWVVLQEFHKRIQEGLKSGHNVTADAFNISRQDRKDILELVPKGVETVAVHLDTPLEIALQQNLERAVSVPETVMRQMFNQLMAEPPSVAEGFDHVLHVGVGVDNHGPVIDRDYETEKLWAELTDVPFDEDDDGHLLLAEDFHSWPKGTEREEIWQWFDKNHSQGVAWLLYELDPTAIH